MATLNRTLRHIFGLPLSIEESDLSDPEKRRSALAGKPYLPNFTKAFQHFCVHAGGRAVIDAIEQNLQLPANYLDASRSVLYNYGNTSSSSIWYEMEYHVKNSHVRRGHRCWQIAFGSGFKWYVFLVMGSHLSLATLQCGRRSRTCSLGSSP